MTTDRKEQTLLKGLVENDRKSVETIYREQYSTIQTLILNNSGSTDDAKDIFQEALVVLYEKAKSGNFELHCQIKTYLFAVARRLWLKKLHQNQHYSPELDIPEETVATDEDLGLYEERTRDFELMDKAMHFLGEPCKSLLEAYYIQKQRMNDIALRFGYTNADNAKNQKYKCLMRLKKLFFDQYNNA